MEDFKFYRARRTTNDTLNGISFKADDLIYTNCFQWVARLGSALEYASPPEEGVEYLTVSSTSEDTPKLQVSSEEAVLAQKERKAFTRKRSSNESVTEGDV